MWDKEIAKESSIPAVPIASFRLWARIYRAQGRSKIAVGEGRPTPAELKKKRRKAARQLLRRDASQSAPLVLAQAHDISPVEILALMLITCADKAKTCTSLLIATILRYSARLMTTGTIGATFYL